MLLSVVWYQEYWGNIPWAAAAAAAAAGFMGGGLISCCWCMECHPGGLPPPWCMWWWEGLMSPPGDGVAWGTWPYAPLPGCWCPGCPTPWWWGCRLCCCCWWWCCCCCCWWCCCWGEWLVGGPMLGPGDIWPCEEVGVAACWCMPPIGESPGGGDPLGKGWPVSMLGGATPGPPPGAFISFLYLDLRFWNQIFT